jgi:hypothetical protein
MAERATTVIATRVPNDLAAAFALACGLEDATGSATIRRLMRDHVEAGS